ncbi:hypothetical protein CDAR_549911 [Caerostris darwini]|uniref:Uncharacterized protein n=1 Tax=Caerostris darwini TaxID=1538125 RepID=A0AAV4QGW2_9ARAC|nr:hypothetical protein CDAR_549911 [Caerostris darwini]
MEDFKCWPADRRIEERQPITDVTLRISSFLSFTILETIPNQSKSCSKAVLSRVTTHVKDRFIAVAKRNRRASSTRVIYMVGKSIGETISVTTMCQRLRIKELYARVPRVFISLTVQSRGAL